MSSRPEESAATWIAGLKNGRQDAADVVWRRYFSRLVRLAERQMAGRPAGVTDAEDVALSAIQCLCTGAQDGRFDVVVSESGLWRLLVRITCQKSIDTVRRGLTERRGGGAVFRESELSEDSRPLSFDEFAGTEPTPETVAILEEQFARLLRLLPPQIPQELIIMKMQGCTNEEIANHFRISVHAVRRKVRLAEQKWLDAEASGREHP